jgi:type I restriction enzyme R subunit
MGIRTTKMEAGLENTIIKYLVEKLDYEYVEPAEMKVVFNKRHAIDEVRVLRFIESTQPEAYENHRLATENGKRDFINQLSRNIAKNGIAKVLRDGVRMYPSGVILFYHDINEKRPSSIEEFNQNIFSVTNQLTYSETNSGLELDLCLFINGLPVFTSELKSRASSTGWTYLDAEEQYKNDRDPKDTLFSFKRCIAHFAVDENNISFTIKLEGQSTRFMPFNKGDGKSGAGNPLGDGIQTDYLWKVFFEKKEMARLISDFCYVVGGKKNEKEVMIFPRYHQWRVVTKLVHDVKKNGVGNRYLIQHSAGSGKSNSITWLAYQLVGLEYENEYLFDSIIVVTDRRNLDRQISENIEKFLNEPSNLEHAISSKKLQELLVGGKKIVTTTIQKFPFIMETIGGDLKGKKFAIIIDEAHSSQSGKAAASLNASISGKYNITEDTDVEDFINMMIESRRMPQNASYFAFTATPKAKTIEMFGKVFDLYSMKQAIEEGFILDVLKNYTTFENYYKVYKTIEDNPDFDAKKAAKKIRKYVEGQEFPINQKASVMVRHFINNTSKKIGGQAKAMIVTGGIERAIDYYYVVKKILKDLNSPFEAIVAFSGEKEYKGKILTETKINGFSDKETPKKFKEEKYKFLIVADKYQTGYDEPLLHTMYVDKVLNDVKAVQTLSRLNRAHKGKIDTCVLDFANSAESIQQSFQPFYQETILEKNTDPNKLYEILDVLDSKYVYNTSDVDRVIEMFFENQPREYIDGIMDQCVSRYLELDEDDQVEFKSGVKSFIRTYNFLSSILPIGQVEWTKKGTFFELLVHRLPTPREEDLSKGILESIDLESYRLEKKNEVDIVLENKDGGVASAQSGVATKGEIEINPLDEIIKNFNDIFGDIDWEDKDNVARQIRELPNIVAKDKRIQNAMKNSDKRNIRIEYEVVLKKVMQSIMKDNMELFLQFSSNDLFNKWLSDTVFEAITDENKSIDL